MATSAPDDTDTDQPATPQSGLDSDSTDAWTDPQASHAANSTSKSAAQTSAAKAVECRETSAHHSQSSSVTAELENEPGPSELSPDNIIPVRANLESAVTQANAAIEIGAAAGDDVLQQILNDLDGAMLVASQYDVSMKYSRKIRSRLQLLLHEAITLALSSGDATSSAAANSNHSPSTAQHSYQWQTAGSKPAKPPSSKMQPPPNPSASPAQQQTSRTNHTHQLHLQQHSHQQLQKPGLQTASSASHPIPPPPPRQTPHNPQSQAGALRLQHAAGAGPNPQPGLSARAEEASAVPKGNSGNAWGVHTKHRSPMQVCSV